MSFTKMNKEDTIRRYITGELSSEDHIKVGDLIREEPEWRLAMERYSRSQQRHSAEFVGTGGSGQTRAIPDYQPSGTPRAVPSSNPSSTTTSAPQNPWWQRFLSGWGLWLAIFLVFRFGSCAKKYFNEFRDRAEQTISREAESPKVDRMIETDLKARYGKADDPAAELIPLCTTALEKAETYYAKDNQSKYLEELLELANNETSPCRDEAMYLAAKAAIDAQDPDLALALISKVSDLDHFNADMQWLIARAFVLQAKTGTLPAAKAKRAIDRAMAFAENEKYKAEAELLLAELGSAL
jgi:hypothetical protein